MQGVKDTGREERDRERERDAVSPLNFYYLTLHLQSCLDLVAFHFDTDYMPHEENGTKMTGMSIWLLHLLGEMRKMTVSLKNTTQAQI